MVKINEARERTELLATVLDAVPARIREGPKGSLLHERAEGLVDALIASSRYFDANHTYGDEQMRRVNQAAAAVNALDSEFSLSDIDSTGGERFETFLSDAVNFVARIGGTPRHEGAWDGKKWHTWNCAVTCWPERFEKPEPGDGADAYEPVSRVVRNAKSLRVVGAGHSFNESSSTGGTQELHEGTLLSLDEYRNWSRVPPDDAMARWGLTADEARHVARVQAGMRLRDFTRAAWADGLALSIAGSTDAQSLGGLIATDVHGSGRTHGFLSEFLLEVKLVRADGRLITFTRQPTGWATDEQPPRWLPWLAAAGALGALGVVVELVVLLEPAYALAQGGGFVDRAWAERELENLLAEHDHVGFFYVGGIRDLKTVRMNTWKRTTERPRWTASVTRLARELRDHAMVAFTPGIVDELVTRDAEKDPIFALMGSDEPMVLPAPAAFARRLYFLHDEGEYGVPIGHFKEAIAAVLALLVAEEFNSLVELRFAPDSTQALLGPGTAGRGNGGAAFFGLVSPSGLHTPARAAAVFERFDDCMRRFGGRPHLGKRTAVDARAMASIHGEDWRAFQALRREWDPEDKFVPRANAFLQKLFVSN